MHKAIVIGLLLGTLTLTEAGKVEQRFKHSKPVQIAQVKSGSRASVRQDGDDEESKKEDAPADEDKKGGDATEAEIDDVEDEEAKTDEADADDKDADEDDSKKNCSSDDKKDDADAEDKDADEDDEEEKPKDEGTNVAQTRVGNMLPQKKGKILASTEAENKKTDKDSKTLT